MGSDSVRRVAVARVSPGVFRATNERGGSLLMSSGSIHGSDFTPVELLLAALGGCSGMDVDAVTSRRAEPDAFEVIVEAEKVRDESGNRLADIVERFRIAFPDTDEGTRARELLPGIVAKSHDRLCTVGRTVQVGARITARLEQPGQPPDAAATARSSSEGTK